MDQALYDQLNEARNANVLKGTDLQDFNTLDAGGEFDQFKQGAAQGAAPSQAAPAPTVAPPPGEVPAQAAAPAALPKIGDTIDSFAGRPPVDLAPDSNLPFGTEFTNRTRVGPESTPNEPYPVARELGRMGTLATTAGPALGGTVAHEASGSRLIGNLVQGGLSAAEMYAIGRLLGIHPLQRVIGPVQTLVRLLGRQLPPGGGTGIPPPPPGTPPGGAPPAAGASSPQSTIFTPYPSGTPPTYH